MLRLLSSICLWLAAFTFAFAQQGPQNPPIYSDGIVNVSGAATVTTTLVNSHSHPSNIAVYAQGAITTWNIVLPVNTYDGQIVAIGCPGGTVTTLNVTSNLSIGTGGPTSCTTGTGAIVSYQYSLVTNAWIVRQNSTSGGGSGSTITANSTTTSGFSAGQFAYSDGSKVQASPDLTIGASGIVTMTQTDNLTTEVSNNPFQFTNPIASNLGLQIWASDDYGQTGPVGGYISEGADSLTLWKGFSWDNVVQGYVSQLGAQEQSGIFLGQSGMQFYMTTPENYPATVTITIATPGVITLANHGLLNTALFYLKTTGTLPTGLTTNTAYCAINVTTNTLEAATWNGSSCGGSPINTSGTQSGTHTLVAPAPLQMPICIGQPATVTSNCGTPGTPGGGPPQVWVNEPLQVNNVATFNDTVFIGISNIGSSSDNLAFTNPASSGFIALQAPNTGALNDGTILIPNIVGTDTFATIGANQTISGSITFSAKSITLTPVAISSLPTCTGSGNVGQMAWINNGVASPTYNAAVSSTGSAIEPVACTYTGSAYGWTYH